MTGYCSQAVIIVCLGYVLISSSRRPCARKHCLTLQYPSSIGLDATCRPVASYNTVVAFDPPPDLAQLSCCICGPKLTSLGAPVVQAKGKKGKPVAATNLGFQSSVNYNALATE